MKKKFTKEEYEIQKEHQLSDMEFVESVLKILTMDVAERMSSHDSEEEEYLSLYATDEQWRKHPMMYALIMGDGLSDEEFDIAFNQKIFGEQKC